MKSAYDQALRLSRQRLPSPFPPLGKIRLAQEKIAAIFPALRFFSERRILASARRGSDEVAKPKRQRKMKQTDDEDREPAMTKTIHGRVRGNTIEFNQYLGVPDGQKVEVQIKVILPTRKQGSGAKASCARIGGIEYYKCCPRNSAMRR